MRSRLSICFQGTETKTYVCPYFSLPSTESTIYTWHDARNHGIRAVLSQVQNGGEKQVPYSSRTLTKSKKNFPVTRREMLPAVEFVKRHRHYLCDRKFFLRIRHLPIPSVLRTREPEVQLARWIEFLITFDINFECRAEKRHINADLMSQCLCT